MPTPDDTTRSPNGDPIDSESLPMAEVVDASLPMGTVVDTWQSRRRARPPVPYRPSILRRFRFVLLVLTLPALLGAGYVLWYDNTPTRVVVKALKARTPERVWGLMTEASRKDWDDWAREITPPGRPATAGYDLFQMKCHLHNTWEQNQASGAKIDLSEERAANGRVVVRVAVDHGPRAFGRYSTSRYEMRRVGIIWKLHYPVPSFLRNEPG